MRTMVVAHHSTERDVPVFDHRSSINTVDIPIFKIQYSMPTQTIDGMASPKSGAKRDTRDE